MDKLPSSLFALFSHLFISSKLKNGVSKEELLKTEQKERKKGGYIKFTLLYLEISLFKVLNKIIATIKAKKRTIKTELMIENQWTLSGIAWF